MHTDAEISLRRWLESAWFRHTARGFMILVGVLVSIGGPLIGWAVFDSRQKAEDASSAVVRVEGDVEVIRQAVDSERRRQQRVEARQGQQLDRMSDRIDDLVGAIGEVTGIVKEISRDGSDPSGPENR
jgi:hypothetical protein